MSTFHLPAALVLLLAAPCCAREQSYQIRLTDFAIVHMIFSGKATDIQERSLADGISEALGGRISPVQVLAYVKELGDVEVVVRARPRFRKDGDPKKKARGLYEVRVYLWEQVGPFASLDYRLRFTEEGGAQTTVRSQLELDIRRFHFRDGDRLVFMLANIRPIHRLINRLAERLVQAAEKLAVEQFVAKWRRDRAKARPINKGR